MNRISNLFTAALVTGSTVIGSTAYAQDSILYDASKNSKIELMCKSTEIKRLEGQLGIARAKVSATRNQFSSANALRSRGPKYTAQANMKQRVYFSAIRNEGGLNHRLKKLMNDCSGQ
jgi:hypothetical protein|tara:strand:- start:214 stop:567 length:354 start_codon:yes stop_codon:yes gene_type:complete